MPTTADPGSSVPIPSSEQNNDSRAISTGADSAQNAPRRRYSEAEEAAFRACGMNPMYGPAQFAGGYYWPDELDRRADRLETLIPHLRLAATALRREIAADPLTAAGVSDG